MLVRLTGRNREDVRDALKRADGNVKVAVLLLQGCDLGEAKAMLSDAGGQLRLAMTALAKNISADFMPSRSAGPTRRGPRTPST
jgi:N-acetylmuramic acid 6-phosphate etherase